MHRLIEKRNEFHPVRDYLNSLTWDNVSRIENLMIDYLGAENSDYTKVTTRKMLVAGVTRIFNPGTKFDYIRTKEIWKVLWCAEGFCKNVLVLS